MHYLALNNFCFLSSITVLKSLFSNSFCFASYSNDLHSLRVCKYLEGKPPSVELILCGFLSLRDCCHLMPSSVGISSMPSTSVYFALYLDFKIFLGRNVSLLQGTLLCPKTDFHSSFCFRRGRITYSNNPRIKGW
jgi:hypothetical protein